MRAGSSGAHRAKRIYLPSAAASAAIRSRLRLISWMWRMSWLPSWQPYSYIGPSVLIIGTSALHGLCHVVGSSMVNS